MMDWIGDVSNFVVGATAHWMATISAAILQHPEVQEALATSVALGVQKLLLQVEQSHHTSSNAGLSKLPLPSSLSSMNNDDNPITQDPQRLLRVLGTWCLTLGGGGRRKKSTSSSTTKNKSRGISSNSSSMNDSTDSRSTTNTDADGPLPSEKDEEDVAPAITTSRTTRSIQQQHQGPPTKMVVHVQTSNTTKNNNNHTPTTSAMSTPVSTPTRAAAGGGRVAYDHGPEDEYQEHLC